MTTLKQRISADYMAAFKSKNAVAKSILSTVKGEIQNVEKNTGQSELDDTGVMKILTKTAKSLKETISLSEDQESKDQLTVVEGYMPKEMSREDVSAKVGSLIASGANSIGMVMKAFAADAVDRKVVAEVFAEMQSEA